MQIEMFHPQGMLAAQLWTFRYDLEKDVPGTLKKIKNLGITYVEGFDAPYIVGNPDKFKSQLDAAGLKMFALHWNDLNDWRKDPTVIIATAKKLGAHYTGIAWLKNSKADTVTLDSCQRSRRYTDKSLSTGKGSRTSTLLSHPWLRASADAG